MFFQTVVFISNYTVSGINGNRRLFFKRCFRSRFYCFSQRRRRISVHNALIQCHNNSFNVVFIKAFCYIAKVKIKHLTKRCENITVKVFTRCCIVCMLCNNFSILAKGIIKASDVHKNYTVGVIIFHLLILK